MPSALNVTGLQKSFSTAEGELSILRCVHLAMQPGESLAILGPSGSGKSTLLYLLGLLDQPTSGDIQLSEAHPHTLSPAEQAHFRNQKIGFVFQDHHLLPQCTVLENVLIPSLVSVNNQGNSEARARQLLERVGLGGRLNHRPAQLSGGERQRVAVCRALINHPLLLLADEPTGNLDRATADAVGSLLLELNREEQTILICVTHSLELAARFPRRCELRDGLLVPVA